MHLHLDPLGGIAGDMFAASLLDLRPDLAEPLGRALGELTLLAGVTMELVPHNDGVLAGHRFLVSRGDGEAHGLHHHDHHGDGHHHHHHHVAWRDIRAALEGSALGPAVRAHAVSIFAGLAEAEGAVHGVPAGDVHFHEVGAWDSIADIVAAAWLIDALHITSCTVGPLPLGSGRVKTAHGPLPVPAPATALLLDGFVTVDDGIAGERVTPTGAAILRHLCRETAPSRPRRIGKSGFGFGTKTLPGISNCLRALIFEEGESTAQTRVAVLEWEVDDQTGEDLATGIDRLRAHPGVIDVVQTPVFGKKGRMMVHLRVLARPEALEAVLEAGFSETTTLGIRHHVVSRTELARESGDRLLQGRTVRLKSAARPGGRQSIKAEADDIASAGDRLAREQLRRLAESEE
ncbi:MAG: LarC family nickel insertion protein [Mesorhizobium amorphae]|nr:MAG: LarC family nickel insertion protein [Mesorhizobium amorphae]